MIVLELLGRVLLPVLLLRADAGALEALLVAAVAVLAVTVLAAVLALVLRALLVLRPAEVRFARLRPLLRVSDPTAPGHRQARAPGATA